MKSGPRQTPRYAVIFRARFRQPDERYGQMAAELRALALAQYNCIEFVALTEGDEEIAISYWDSLDDIRSWKQNETHRIAQSMGKEKWYDAYEVQLVQINKAYTYPA